MKTEKSKVGKKSEKSGNGLTIWLGSILSPRGGYSTKYIIVDMNMCYRYEFIVTFG